MLATDRNPLSIEIVIPGPAKPEPGIEEHRRGSSIPGSRRRRAPG
jgi:hypothetical protein